MSSVIKDFFNANFFRGLESQTVANKHTHSWPYDNVQFFLWDKNMISKSMCE